MDRIKPVKAMFSPRPRPLILTLLAMLAPSAVLADGNALPTELLTVIERPIWLHHDNHAYAKLTLVAYDPITLLRRELAVLEEARSSLGLYWTSLGDSLITVDRKTAGALIQMRKGQRTTTAFPEAVGRQLEQAEGSVRTLEPSPDGHGWLMRVGQSSLILHHEQMTRTFDLDWIDWEGGMGMHETDFSWSPDSRKVAFYYAYEEGMRASPAVRDFGIALVTLDDGVVELVKPSGRTTTWLGDEVWPPQWSPDSRYVYYIQGPVPGEKVPPKVYPIYTYRVDTRTGQEEKLIQGQAAAVAPDNSYMLVSMHSAAKEDGEVQEWIGKFDLQTREVKLLPPVVSLPRISPSGRYVAGVHGQRIRFLDASTWSQIGETGPLSAAGSATEWCGFCRWITLEAPPQPAVPTTQP